MKRSAYFFIETLWIVLLVVAMRKYKNKLSSLNEQERCAVINAIKETAIYYMNQGLSYGYSCATAASQANFGKCEVMRALQKERDLTDLRDKHTTANRFNKRKFLLGVEASADALKAFKELEGK